MGGRQKIKCRYCDKLMPGGGISRLKQHLAGERGNVSPCEEVPEAVKVQIIQHLCFRVLEKLKRQKGTKSSKNSVSYFRSREPGVDVAPRTESTKRCSSKREVVEGISSRPKRIMTKNLQPVDQNFTSVTGCSIMVDQWTDRNGCIVLNFFAYCPKGIMFLKSVNGSNVSKSPEELLNLFQSVVQEVGQNSIVNFVTDTSPTSRSAGKLVAEKCKSFFFSTCAPCCIDLMLEEIGKIIDAREVLGKAKRITQLIHNNSWSSI